MTHTDIDALPADLFQSVPTNIFPESNLLTSFDNNLGSAIASSRLNKLLLNPSLQGSDMDNVLIGQENRHISILGAAGNDTIAGHFGHDVLLGESGNDVLRGDLNLRQPGTAKGGDDLIFGGEGRDRLGGKGGNDWLIGGPGNDALWGDHGSDVLYGGLGEDVLVGDDFSGGTGNDIFALMPGMGTDIIADFGNGEDRILLLDGLIFEHLTLKTVEGNTLIKLDNETLAIALDTNLSETDFFFTAADLEQIRIKADELPELSLHEGPLPLIGFIDFTKQQHDHQTLEIFQSIPNLEEQEHTLIHADNGNWAEKLTQFVDQVKISEALGAVVNLGFDLTQFDDLQHVTTRYELTPAEQQAIQYAQNNNVLLVVAAGNTGDKMSALGSAAQTFDNILVVGAVNNQDEKADYSAQGKGLSLVAPGGEWINNPTAFVGTSRSTAYVTAAVTLAWQANPVLNYQQVKAIVLQAADDLGEPGWDPETGAGLLDVEESILLAQQTEEEELTVATPIQIKPFSGEGRVDPLVRPASDSQVAENQFLEVSSKAQNDFWKEILGADNSLDASTGEYTFNVLNQYQESKAEVAVLAEQERLLEEGLALIEQQAQVDLNKGFILQDEYQVLNQDLQNLSFNKFVLENQVAIYEAFTNGQGSSLQQKLQNAGIELGEGSQGELLAARIIELESTIASEQQWLNKNSTSSPIYSGVKAERDAYTYELQAIQDLLTIDSVQKQQELERINLEITQKQQRIANIQQDLVETQSNLTQLDLQLGIIPNELEAIRLAHEAGQEELRSLLEIAGYSLPYRERIDAIQSQVEYLEQRLDEVSTADKSTQDVLSKELEWAQAHLSTLTAIDVSHTFEDASSQLITDLQNYQNSIDTHDLPVQEYIDYLNEIRDNQQVFLAPQTVIAQTESFAKNVLETTEQNLENLWGEHVQLTVNQAQLKQVLSDPNLIILNPGLYQVYQQQLSEVETLLDEKFESIQLTERYIEQVKDFAEKLQNWNDFFAQIEKETIQHEQESEQWIDLNQAQDILSQSILNSFEDIENLEALLLDLDYLSAENELLTLVTQLENQKALVEEFLEQDEQLKQQQLYYYNLYLKHEANIWATGSYDTFEAAAARENHQEASLIADQRNKLWVQIQTALNLVNKTEAQKTEQEATVENAKQNLIASGQDIPEYDTAAELQAQLTVVSDELAPFFTQLGSQLSALEANITDSQNQWASLQETMQLRTEAVRKLLNFGLVASESDPDYFFSQIEPQVETFISQLQQQSQLLESSIDDLVQVVENLDSRPLSEAVGDAKFIETYLETSQTWQDDIATTVHELQEHLNDTLDSLAILRQQQELDETLQAPRPELVTTEAANAALQENSVQSYAQLHDQVADDLVSAVKTWTKDLQASHQITQDLIAAQSTQSQAVDDLIATIQDQLVEPYGQYRIAKSHLRDQITTQKAVGDRDLGFAQVLSDTRNQIETLNLKLDQHEQLWESLNELAARNGLESSAIVKLREIYNQIPTRLILESWAAQYNLLATQHQAWPQIYQQYRSQAISFEQQAQLYPLVDDEESVSILKNLIEQARAINPGYVDGISAVKDYLDELEQGFSQLPSRLDSFEIIDSIKPSKLILQELSEDHSQNTENTRIRYSSKLTEATNKRQDLVERLDPNNPTSLHSLLYGYGGEVKGLLTQMDEAWTDSSSWRETHDLPPLDVNGGHYPTQATIRKRTCGPFGLICGDWSEEIIINDAMILWLRLRDQANDIRSQISSANQEINRLKNEEIRLKPIINQWKEAENAASQAEWQTKQARNTLEQLKAKTDYQTPKFQSDLQQSQSLLLILEKQTVDAQQEAQAIKASLEQAWETYVNESQDYREATVSVLEQQSEIDRQALQYRSILAEVERWARGQTIATDKELQQALVIKADLESAIQSVQGKMTIANPPELTELKTKAAQLQESLALLLSKINVLEARQASSIQKQVLIAASDAVIIAEEKLLQAYLVNPDQDTSTLEAELSAARGALAEAQRLAEQAEASSQALTQPLQELREELLARNDEHIQQARQQQQVLQDLREATELNLNYTLKATEAQQKVNVIESQIITQLQQAVDAGNQEAISLLRVAETNDRATLAELYYTDYGDLASDKKFAKPEYRQLADQYYQEWQHLSKLKEQEQQQADHWRQLRQKAEEQLEVLKQEGEEAQKNLDFWNDRIAETQEEIEAKEQALAVAQVRLESIEQLRAETEQMFVQIASLEQLNLAQAELEVQIAARRDADIEQSIQERLAREQQEINRKRKIVLVQLEQLKQIQSEEDLQQNLNTIRNDLGMTDLDIVESPVQLHTQMADLLNKLDSLENEEPDLPDNFKALLTETKEDIHLALQGEEAANIQANLLAVVDGLVEQIEQYKAELAQIDLESQQEIELLQLAQSDLQEAAKQLIQAAEDNQELQEQLNSLNRDYRLALEGVAYAEQQVDISEQWAKQALAALDQIIAQRKEARQLRKKAFWNKILSGLSTVAGIAGTIISFIPGLQIVGVGLVAASAGINAIQSAINGDWAGAIFGAVMAGISAVTAGAGNVLGQIATRSLKGIQAVASGAFNGIRSIKSGAGILGALQIVGGAAGAAVQGLGQVVGKLTSTAQKFGYQVLNSLQKAPLLIYGGIESIKTGDWLSGLNHITNAAATIGQNFANVFDSAMEDFFKGLNNFREGVSKWVTTGKTLANSIKSGSMESWLSGITDISGVWAEDIGKFIADVVKPPEFEKFNSSNTNLKHRTLEKLNSEGYKDYSVGETIEIDGVSYFVEEVLNNPESDLNALLLKDENGNAIISFRGTDSLKDLGSDLHPFGVGFNQLNGDSETIEKWVESNPGVTLTGHSLGGALAQFAAVKFPEYVGEVVTFNSPGLSGSQLTSRGYQDFEQDNSHITTTHYVIEGDLVSFAGSRFIPGEVYVIQQPDGSAISRHKLEYEDGKIGRLGQPDLSIRKSSIDELNNPDYGYRNLMYDSVTDNKVANTILFPVIHSLGRERQTAEFFRTIAGVLSGSGVIYAE